MARHVCSVVDGWTCTHPANFQNEHPLRTRCFACGEPVCVPCSTMMTWHTYGIRRICHDCRRDEERFV